MSLCHLYDVSKYNHIEKILNSFQESVSLELSTIESLDEYDIYIIELNETTKEISLQLKQFFQDKYRPLIYFIVPKTYTLMFFQLTYLLETQDLIIQSQDPEKIIKRIISDEGTHLENSFETLLAKKTIKDKKIIFYKNMTLKKVSQELLNIFNCKDTLEFQESVVNQIDIKNLLEKDAKIEKTVVDFNFQESTYTIESQSLGNEVKIITFKKNIVLEKNLAFICSRTTFIEMLKDKHIQNSIVKNKLSAMSIKIQNLDIIKDNLNPVEYEYLLLDFLSFMASIIEKKIIFSEIEKNFYVILFENISDKEREEIASNFNTKMLNYIAGQKNKPYLDIYTLSLTSIPFNEILTTLENICHQKISYTERTSYSITHTSDIQNIISAKTLLDQTFKYKTSLKMLNIYKGLVIKTKAKIIKTTSETVYIQFEALQGVVLNLEKETILQAPIFMQDIHAHVKVINLQKKIAVLEKFEFLKSNPDARQYSRVTMANNTPVSVRFDDSSLNGSIIDISIKSIAIKTKYTDKVRSIKGQPALIMCNIPSSRSDNGFLRIELHCVVIATTIQDTQNNCKVICNLNEDSRDISHIMEFIYERQKALIIELKKTSKLN